MTITIPNAYGYVIASIGAMAVPNFYGAYKVIQARKRYGVKYPDLYAPHGHANKKEFDCAQRAHQNTLESWPAVAACAIVDGIVFPVTTAVCVGIWCVGRLMYIHGYSSGVPDKRQFGGMLAHVGDLPLLIMTFVAAKAVLA